MDGDKFITAIVGVLTAIIGVAIIATLVSNQSNTANVLTAGAGGFSSILKTALSPVTSGSSLLGGFSASPGGSTGTLSFPPGF